MILGIDPGPVTCGAVLYDETARRVSSSSSAAPVDEVLDHWLPAAWDAADVIAIERVQAQGVAGGDIIRTAEVVGRLWQATLDHGVDYGVVDVRLLYRREVLAALDVTGRGNRDALVRARLIEMHGGTKKAAQGTKKARGPLYGVSGHAWSALGVAVAAQGAGRVG